MNGLEQRRLPMHGQMKPGAIGSWDACLRRTISAGGQIGQRIHRFAGLADLEVEQLATG